MAFAGFSYLAILIAAVAGWLAGAVWYGGLVSRQWVAAQGYTMEEFRARQEALKGTSAAWMPFVLAFLANLVMAWVLAGIVGHMGRVTLRTGVESAAFAWVGFVATTMATNYAFGGRTLKLWAIDAAHWLIVLLVMGVTIGLWGV